jgi:hypothetical protein
MVLFLYPIDSGRLSSILTREAFAQALGVEPHPHPGGEPLTRLRARLSCETLKFGFTGRALSA